MRMILEAVCLILCASSLVEGGAAGGLSGLIPADSFIQKLINDVKSSVEDSLGRKLAIYTAISYKSQVVAGFNYFVKVKVGDNQYIHLRIHQNIHNKSVLHGILLNKSLTDEIVSFVSDSSENETDSSEEQSRLTEDFGSLNVGMMNSENVSNFATSLTCKDFSPIIFVFVILSLVRKVHI